MKLTVKVAIGLLAAGVIGLFLARQFPIAPSYMTVEFSSVNVTAEVAATPEARARGLSGRQKLGDDEGMLFITNEQGFHHFHMKDMNFPIDIIWLDENLRVVDITRQLDPGTYPKTFTSSRPARYVLEVNAGFAAEHRINRGDMAGIDQRHLDSWKEYTEN